LRPKGAVPQTVLRAEGGVVQAPEEGGQLRPGPGDRI